MFIVMLRDICEVVTIASRLGGLEAWATIRSPPMLWASVALALKPMNSAAPVAISMRQRLIFGIPRSSLLWADLSVLNCRPLSGMDGMGKLSYRIIVYDAIIQSRSSSQEMRAKDTRPGTDALSRLAPLEARTLVDQVVDAIVEATATGAFLPGDRVVEAEVARALNVSRVPVREALRILESQGIVVNERYRGMRLMDVSADRLEKILKVRNALETLAAHEILDLKPEQPDILMPLEARVRELHAAVAAGDSFGVARLDTEFHRTLCQISGNGVLLQSWEPLSRQLTIIFGLSTLQKPIRSIAREHDDVLDALRAGDRAAVTEMIRVHILDYSRELDYEGLVSAHRFGRTAKE